MIENSGWVSDEGKWDKRQKWWSKSAMSNASKRKLSEALVANSNLTTEDTNRTANNGVTPATQSTNRASNNELECCRHRHK